MCQLMNKRFKLYGGLNIVFAGNYAQMEPVGDITIYNVNDIPEFHSALNCF